MVVVESWRSAVRRDGLSSVGWQGRTRTLGLLALAVIATGAVHGVFPSVMRWGRARTERLADAELATRERALVGCLLGGEVGPSLNLDDRVRAIETAHVLRGDVVANDAEHWPGRCAPLARAVSEVVHLGNPALRPDQIETLGLVLGDGRPWESARRESRRATSSASRPMPRRCCWPGTLCG